MVIDLTSDTAISDGRDSLAEQALVTSARAGDADAFGQLVQLHERIVVRTALAALGRRDDAEDVAQDAFVLAWRKLPAFRGEASFRTWLLTIVWREALARRKARARWWERFVSPRGGDREDELFIERMGSTKPSPEDIALGRSEGRAIARAIATLPRKLRDTLLLSASGEHSYEEIAHMLGVATGTIKWRVSEARRLVARTIEEHRESRQRD
jgi:RNA polymerase sigma-70 factor (ECF subfamily)